MSCKPRLICDGSIDRCRCWKFSDRISEIELQSVSIDQTRERRTKSANNAIKLHSRSMRNSRVDFENTRVSPSILYIHRRLGSFKVIYLLLDVCQVWTLLYGRVFDLHIYIVARILQKSSRTRLFPHFELINF